MVKKSWLPKYFAIAIGCIVAVFAADASAAFGSRFQGNVGYSIVGNNVYLTVDQVLNTDTSGSSNTLRLELWALSSPLTGGSYTGYRLAVYPLGTLSAGAGISNINSGALPYSPPPNGRWYLALTLDEFDNLNVDDGYGYDEYHNFPNAVTFPAASPGTASVVEYYYAAADHYFITATPSEIAALDSNRFPGWLRTGLGFGAYAGPTAGANPVCRYYIPPASHFYSASPAECALTGQRFPSFVSEPNSVFYIALPDTTTGACPGGAAPIYRLFDNRADPNHR
jgi:hypothetical protein